jgi:hypothetical protein
MRRAPVFSPAAVLAGLLCLLPATVRADGEKLDLDHINVRYHGGALLEHARVHTLFWGRAWETEAKGQELREYLNSFFRDLFADRRFMANLAQYSVPGHRIENGELGETATDAGGPAARVTDARIQAEIRQEIAAGHLPPPEENSLYFVFTPPGVVVDDGTGADSENDFGGYHDYSWGGPDGDFAYAVIPYSDDHEIAPGNPHLLTDVASHELAEAVTDPQPRQVTLSWYDDNNGEIGDIPDYLYYKHRIGRHDLWDVLEGTNGRRYLVQKEWSVKDGAPVAFAAAAKQ